jgi:hypothetical protein
MERNYYIIADLFDLLVDETGEILTKIAIT